MIAAPHLLFAITLGIAALVAWPLLTDTNDTPLMVAQAVVLGLITGGILTVVIP